MTITTAPTKDKDLTTLEEITERINSLDRQVEKKEDVQNPRDYRKHHIEIMALLGRRGKLQDRRAAVLKAKKEKIKMDYKSRDKFDSHAEYVAYQINFHKQRILDVNAGKYDHFQKSFRITIRDNSANLLAHPGEI